MAAVSVKRSIVSSRNRTAGRRGRLNAWVWQTWQGYNLRVLSWSSLNINMSFGLLGKYLFKGRWSSAESFFKKKLLSGMPHRVFRLFSSSVLLCKFTIHLAVCFLFTSPNWYFVELNCCIDITITENHPGYCIKSSFETCFD